MTPTDHDQPASTAARIRTAVDAEVGEDYAFIWALASLDENDLFHLRSAVQRYFRHVAAQTVGDALDIRFHVLTIERVGELVAAIETVEKARAEATTQQTKWRDAQRAAKYRAEQAEMRRKQAERVRPKEQDPSA